MDGSTTLPPVDASAPAGAPQQIARPAGRRWRIAAAILRNPNAIAGTVVLLSVVLLALAAPALYPGDPLEMVARPFLWPGVQIRYPLGTDSLGRDVAAGLAHGARASLLVGFAATLIGVAAGTLVGAIGGFYGGWIDDLLVRVTELIQTVPAFLFVVVLVAIFQPTIAVIAIAIGGVSWPTIARLVRAEFRTIRQMDYVLAARSLGFGDARIIVREILPNAAPSIIVTGSVMVATAILTESALSFLGMGDPNVVSWGSMIGAGRELLRTAWYLTALPGAAIVVTVLALNLIGDALNDALNPRLDGR